MPAVLEFTDNTEDDLLAAIITNLDPTLTSFKLSFKLSNLFSTWQQGEMKIIFAALLF